MPAPWPVDRLDDDGAHGDEEDPRVRDGGEDGEPTHAVGAARRRLAAGEDGAGPGQDQGEDVAEVVACVGDEREGVGADAESQLGDDERHVEPDPDGERAIEARRPMDVSARAMSMDVSMRIVVRMVVAILVRVDVVVRRSHAGY